MTTDREYLPIIRDEGGGVEYVPFISSDGRVGYRIVVSATGQEGFIYLNPSANTTEAPDDANVFVYVGVENDPAKDAALTFIATDPRTMID